MTGTEIAFDDGFFGYSEKVEVEPKEWMKEKKFTLVSSIEQLKSIVDRAIKSGYCALDLETTGLDNRINKHGETVDKIVGYCLSYDGQEGFYVPVRHKEDGKAANLNPKEVIVEIGRLCEKCVTIYHNSPFDHEFLYGEGVEIDSFKQFEDTLILDYLRHSSDKRHGLKHLSERFLGMTMIDLKELFPERVKDRDFSTLDPRSEYTLWYAGSDAICTYLLFQWYRSHKWVPKRVRKEYEDKEGNRRSKIELEFVAEPVASVDESIYSEQPFAYYIEKICVPALRWMERNRPKVDLDYLARVRYEVNELMTQAIDEITEGIRERGYDFHRDDVSSPKKLGEALAFLKDQGFIKVDLPRTNNGQVQTSDTVISMLSEKVGDKLPFIRRISTFRKLQKVDGTYLKPLQENTDGYQRPDGTRNPSHVLQDSTIRFSFLPHRVDTGRFAASKGKTHHGYSGINVQSMPAGYNTGKFSGKLIYSRPEGRGAPNPVLFKNLVDFIEGDFLIRVYDNHFVTDPLKNKEYCVRETCEGCPFLEECDHDPQPDWDDKENYYKRNVKILSLDASARPAIVARDGYVISAIDQSGVELRMAASISQEPKWIEEFYRCSTCNKEYPGPEDLNPEAPLGSKKWDIVEKPPLVCVECGSDKIGDLHTLTTRIVYGDDIVSKPDFKQYRQKAKGANFAILYGGSGSAVARATGVSKEEGYFIRNQILDGLPRLNTWFSEVISTCKSRKGVSTGVGRQIRLPDIDNEESWISAKAERNAVNGIIQGTATGDLTKYAMGQVYMYMKTHGYLDDCRLIITVHDELVFEIRKDKMNELFPVITNLMTKLGDKLKWAVPLACDVEFGQNFNVAYNWGALHSINPDTGRTDVPVPKWLWNHIDMKPGMWYIDDEGNEVVIEGDLEPESDYTPERSNAYGVDESHTNTEGSTAESVEKEEAPAPDPCETYSSLRDYYMETKETRMGRTSKKVNGPVFTFQLINAPGLLSGNNPTQIRVLFRYLFQILDFFKAEGNGSYALRVLDWKGDVVLSESDKHLVEPKDFLLLARFFGITGEEVR